MQDQTSTKFLLASRMLTDILMILLQVLYVQFHALFCFLFVVSVVSDASTDYSPTISKRPNTMNSRTRSGSGAINLSRMLPSDDSDSDNQLS